MLRTTTPRATAAVDLHPAPAAAAPEAVQAQVLLVDDQPGRLLAYEAMLHGLGVACVKASSGAKALERVLERPFAVILLDVHMPEMDGFEVARLVRQHPRYGTTPIIFVTAAHSGELDLMKGYELGAIDYLSMPVAPEVLRSKVAVLVAMQHKRNELEALNRSLESARCQLVVEQESALAEANRRKDEFLAMLAHELRNPVAPIRTAAEVLSMLLNGDARKRAMVDIIQRQCGTLSRILDDLLDVARITQGRIELRREVVSLAECVEAAVQSTGPLMREKAHRIEVMQASEPLHVSADRVRLEQCVCNLLTNAAKFTPQRGEISVQMRAVGIAPAFLPHVFDLFSQNERSMDRSQGGLGLGLSICRQLIQLHGGSVGCSSAGEAQGTTVTIRLPRVLGVQQRAAPPVAAVPTRRVLVVDDNHDAADTLTLWLDVHGHATRTAYSAEAALEAVAGFGPDVVLLDLGLPGMDGYEVARRIKRQHPAMRVIALSGYGQSRDRAASAAAGFDAHAVKPVDMAELDRLLAG